jgi:predicted metal-dependent hydrolase
VSNDFGMVQYGDTIIRYRIIRKASRRTLEIKIHPDLSIMVTVPQGARAKEIEEKVHRKADWIIRNQWEIARLQRQYPREFVSGESYWYLGRQFALKVEQTHEDGVSSISFANSRFIISVPLVWASDRKQRAIREAFVAWYRGRAKLKLPEMASYYDKRLGVEPHRITITDMVQRWGSCGRNQVLRFNWRVMMAPISLIEYVVAHEACHLRHKDHSKDFWKLLDSLMPDYEVRRDRLAREGGNFHL